MLLDQVSERRTIFLLEILSDIFRRLALITRVPRFFPAMRVLCVVHRLLLLLLLSIACRAEM